MARKSAASGDGAHLGETLASALGLGKSQEEEEDFIPQDFQALRGAFQARLAADGELFVWSPDRPLRGGNGTQRGVCGRVTQIVYAGVRIEGEDGVQRPAADWRVVAPDECADLRQVRDEREAAENEERAEELVTERRSQWEATRPGETVERADETEEGGIFRGLCVGCAAAVRALRDSGAPAGRWPRKACALCGKPESVMKNPIPGLHALCVACVTAEDVCGQCNCSWS
jgi:hypothetical protein